MSDTMSVNLPGPKDSLHIERRENEKLFPGSQVYTVGYLLPRTKIKEE
jgi:hypothetical protein